MEISKTNSNYAQPLPNMAASVFGNAGETKPNPAQANQTLEEAKAKVTDTQTNIGTQQKQTEQTTTDKPSFRTEDETVVVPIPKKDPNIIEIVKPGYGKFEPGLFNLYLNTKGPDVFMEIKKNQLNKPFMCSITRTASDASEGESLDSSAMIGCYPIIFKRNGNKIYFYAVNTKVKSEGGEEMRRITDENKSDYLIASVDIKDEKNDVVLINAGGFFINKSAVDYCTIIDKAGIAPKIPYELKSGYFNLDNINSFGKNTEIESCYIFASNASHKYNFSISYLPSKEIDKDGRAVKNDYTPRPADDRLGNFTVNYKVYGNLDKHDKKVSYVTRWDIKPGGKPVVFWIDKAFTKDEKYKKYAKAIEDGVLLWNTAIEDKCGIKNAIEVKHQENEPKCKVGDVNYNVISLTNNQEKGIYAIGPSYADPETGQIYAADLRISEEFIAVAWKKAEDLEKRGILKTAAEKEKFVLDRIRINAAHETGHALGFSHNFMGSTVDAGNGNLGSIMDYIPPNIEEGKKSGNFWPKKLGPYDLWVLEYTYTPDEKNLQKIASRSNEPQLIFGRDIDAFNPTNPDPLCNKEDLGKEPLNFYKQEIARSKEFWNKQLEAYYEKHPEKSYAEFREDFFSGFSAYGKAADIVPKYIGGVYHKRGNAADLGKEYPVEPVPEEKQKEALKFLTDTFFAPSAFYFKDSLVKKLGTNVDKFYDFDIYGEVLDHQKTLLYNLYHPFKLSSIISNKSRGSRFTIEKLFTVLREEIWTELKTGVNINIYRRNLQQEHISKLIEVHTGIYTHERPDGTKTKIEVPAEAVAMAGKDLETIHADIVALLTKVQDKKVKLEEYVINHLILAKDNIEKEIPRLKNTKE